uniref:Uncharacterized protein n=2 Tax=Oryza TaxID=4527 RepID=A0A0D3HWU4_9ORYZ
MEASVHPVPWWLPWNDGISLMVTKEIKINDSVDGPQVSGSSATSIGQPKLLEEHVVLYDLRPNLFSEIQSKRRTGDKARGEKKALKVKINLASPAKKIKKSIKKKGTKKKGTVAGRIGRKCTLSRDSKGRFLPRESKGGDIGGSATESEVDYDRFMNFQAPDFATILSILKGWKGMKQCNKIRRLKDPDFVPLMNVMSNTGYVTEDDGHYDVLKVLMHADGWSA